MWTRVSLIQLKVFIILITSFMWKLSFFLIFLAYEKKIKGMIELASIRVNFFISQSRAAESKLPKQNNTYDDSDANERKPNRAKMTNSDGWKPSNNF